MAQLPRFATLILPSKSLNSTPSRRPRLYLASLPALLGRGELDSQTALELSTLVRNWLSAIYERQEYDLRVANAGGAGEQIIHITGGLPPLPGSNIIGMGGDGPMNGASATLG